MWRGENHKRKQKENSTCRRNLAIAVQRELSSWPCYENGNCAAVSKAQGAMVVHQSCWPVSRKDEPSKESGVSGRGLVKGDRGVGNRSASPSAQTSSVAARRLPSSIASRRSTETTKTKKKANHRQQTRKEPKERLLGRALIRAARTQNTKTKKKRSMNTRRKCAGFSSLHNIVARVHR